MKRGHVILLPFYVKISGSLTGQMNRVQVFTVESVMGHHEEEGNARGG